MYRMPLTLSTFDHSKEMSILVEDAELKVRVKWMKTQLIIIYCNKEKDKIMENKDF